MGWVSGRKRSIQYVIRASASTFENQVTSTEDERVQINFGDPVDNDFVSINADGRITFKKAGSYHLNATGHIGSTGGTGLDYIFTEIAFNGDFDDDATRFVRIGYGSVEAPSTQRVQSQFDIDVNAGDYIDWYFVRDSISTGTGSSGYVAFQSTDPEVGDAHSVALTIGQNMYEIPN